MIIDGVYYTEKELALLRQYTCRAKGKDFEYGQRSYEKTNRQLGVNPNSNNIINKFLLKAAAPIYRRARKLGNSNIFLVVSS